MMVVSFIKNIFINFQIGKSQFKFVFDYFIHEIWLVLILIDDLYIEWEKLYDFKNDST